MRVLVVTNMYPKCGDARSSKGVFVKEQVDALRREPEIDEVRVLNIDNGSVFYKYIFSSINVVKCFFKFQPDVIHVHYGLTFLPVLLAYPFLRRVRIITTFHGSDVLGRRSVFLISKVAAKLSCRSIAVSDEIRSSLGDPGKIHVLPCAVGERFFNIKRDIKKIQPIIIFPSSPARVEKNYAYFSRVIESLKSYGVDFEVRAMHGLTRSDVIDLFSISSVLLLTSDREGSPQVVKEALAAGLPVVSRKVGDLEEMSKHVEGLYLIDSEEAMVDRAVDILVSDSLKVCINSGMIQIYGEKYIIKRLMSLYGCSP